MQAQTGRHGIVSRIIILPYFRQATAALNCDNMLLRWPGPFGSGFLSPQPPGVVGIGPVAVTPPLGQRKLVLFLFWGDAFRRRVSRRHCERSEAIQFFRHGWRSEELDCFVASAPRNDGKF